MIIVDNIHFPSTCEHHGAYITTARRGVFLAKPQLETRFLEYLRMQDGKPDML